MAMGSILLFLACHGVAEGEGEAGMLGSGFWMLGSGFWMLTCHGVARGEAGLLDVLKKMILDMVVQSP
ncbi:MAG: hypothetical protein K9K79_08360 [Desulfohalobiaceae bacterium]|nr:hypothetical protein [Desulfohalobiaceae bacterium]